jgi:type VI protein secretion system component Hcp
MTIKTQSQTPAAKGTDDLQLRLNDGELDRVVGGIHVTKVVDSASPNLFLGAVLGSGKHVSID